MDEGTAWLVGIGVVTAFGTWALAAVTWSLARKTKQMAEAASETARLTAESLHRSLLVQELAALAPLAEGERASSGLFTLRVGPGPARIRCDEIMQELGIVRDQSDEASTASGTEGEA